MFDWKSWTRFGEVIDGIVDASSSVVNDSHHVSRNALPTMLSVGLGEGVELSGGKEGEWRTGGGGEGE